MSEPKYVVPEGMLKAVQDKIRQEITQGPSNSQDYFVTIIEAALRWQSENPPVPTDAQLDALMEEFVEQCTETCSNRYIPVEWIRRMYLVPEPEEPESVDAVKDLMFGIPYTGNNTASEQAHNFAILEAYRRGKAGK